MRNICRRISTPAQMACPSPELKELNKKGYRKMNKPTDQTIKEPLFAAFSETAPSNTALADSAYSEGSPAGNTPARPVSGANESAGKKETGKAEDENSDSEQDSTTSGKGGKKRKVPITDKTASETAGFINAFHSGSIPEDYLFYQRRKGSGKKMKMTAYNAERIVKRMLQTELVLHAIQYPGMLPAICSGIAAQCSFTVRA